MDRTDMSIKGGNQELFADAVPFARSYQLEALDKALKQNTIVFLETGSGKTLIAIMLIRSYAHVLRKPSPYIAVLLVPTVILVTQQSSYVEMHTDLRVGKFYGELGIDFWDSKEWERQKKEYEVFVMTPRILLDALYHTFLRLDEIKVLVFDECHNARGKHPYACIMTEFYHRHLAANNRQLPRIFGMTASPIKAKASSSAPAYWNSIRDLENLMDSKVFTCESDSVLTRYIPFSTPKVKLYEHSDIPQGTMEILAEALSKLVKKHELPLNGVRISESITRSTQKRLHELLSIFKFCLSELGIWLAMKAAEAYSREEADIFSWGKLSVSVDNGVRAFCSDAAKIFMAFMPSDPRWSICHNSVPNVNEGYLTRKVLCLVETLLEYREIKSLRCIIFVERIVTAIVIRSLLNEWLPNVNGWRTEYTAGNSSRLQSQSRKEQNAIVDEFRKGTVNIIVATSMLEEGLDVQSCNLVIRFDPSSNICSFIQSRGRARMQNSDFILMVKSGDASALARLENYLSSAGIMRSECLSHADLPCEPLGNEMYDEPWYKVERTGAILTLGSSIQLIYHYCSRLPSDGYFKPYPRFTVDKELQTCTLQLPNSCPVQTIVVEGNKKSLKKLACLEACKQLHQVGALTDYLVPDIVQEEADVQEFGYEPYWDTHPKYFPPQLISSSENENKKLYHCFSIEMRPDFLYDIKFQDIVLAVHTRLENDLEDFKFDLDTIRGNLMVGIKYIGHALLNSDQVALCRRFQMTVFRVLLDHNLNKLQEDLDGLAGKNSSLMFDYLLLPSLRSDQTILFDMECINAVQFSAGFSWNRHICRFSARGNGGHVHTKNGMVCYCMLENSLVCTPHNGLLYCITGTLDKFDGNSILELRNGERVSYAKYYEKNHGIKLLHIGQKLLNGKQIFTVQNYLQRSRVQRAKESSNTTYELPPELCKIVMSPISISTFYTFSFLPSVMHRIESLLISSNLKNMCANISQQSIAIPSFTVLEAITTKKCQEKVHLESLETLGDSFLKYAATQQLFKNYQNQHEGLLSIKRERIISNVALCRLGREREITGFIRNEPFDPKTWTIPGTNCGNQISEETVSSKKVYCGGTRKLKSKTIADVLEALIGAFLSAGGELAALSCMSWLGINVDFVQVPYTRSFSANPEVHVNIGYLETLLNYTFKDASLLVEALTHGSYMLPEIPQCYQRLEFLGDAVLDYLITVHLYLKYPGLSPGLLTDLRSASVNNDCYALAALKRGLYKHILHTSQELHNQIPRALRNFEEITSASTFGWESETTFPKVLGDVIESLAGAILVDSGYNKDIVFRSIKPLLEPLITPDTLRLHPVRELTELCHREHYVFKKPVVFHENGIACVAVEVEANGVVHKASCSGKDKKMAKRLACKSVLKSLKEGMSDAHD